MGYSTRRNININIVECKFERNYCIAKTNYYININIVECKFDLHNHYIFRIHI